MVVLVWVAERVLPLLPLPLTLLAGVLVEVGLLPGVLRLRETAPGVEGPVAKA